MGVEVTSSTGLFDLTRKTPLFTIVLADGVTRDDLEDFNIRELEGMFELYEEVKDNDDPNPQQ